MVDGIPPTHDPLCFGFLSAYSGPVGLANLSVGLVLEIVELVAILALGAGAWLLHTRTAPAALERRQKRVESQVVEFGTQVDSIVAQRATWKAQGEALVEEVETYFERIEKKRASTAASASRAAQAAAPVDVSALPRGQQIAIARRASG